MIRTQPEAVWGERRQIVGFNAEADGPVTGIVRTATEVGRRLARATDGAPSPPPTAPGVDVRRVRPGVAV